MPVHSGNLGSTSRHRVDVGFVNNLDWADADLPFGGVKTSGYGRELGDMGIQQFVNKKLVRISTSEAPALAAAARPSQEPLEFVGEKHETRW